VVQKDVLIVICGSNETERKMLPEHYPTDRESLERDCELEFFIASGPGGQHRNKVETGVRLTHRPSGIVVTATERRSQHANREEAYERMAARLEEMQQVATPRKPTRPTAASRERRLEAKRRTAMLKKQRTIEPGE
jgi:protein subunit release factor B